MGASREAWSVVTGATDGIGRQTALELLARGHRVILHGRSKPKLEQVAAQMRTAHPRAALEWVCFELGSLAEVRAGAQELLARFDRIGAVIANAGVYPQGHQLSVDGYELSFAVNHLAHFYLIHLLLPRLEESAPSRVVVLSSIAHHRGELELEGIALGRDGSGSPVERFDGYRAYASSKLANLLFAQELARRCEGSGVDVNAVHPGVIDTKMLRDGFGKLDGAPIEEGARCSIYVATAAELQGVSGKYFADSKPARSASRAQDLALQQGLWSLSEKLCGLSQQTD
ncbi:MAG: SDR family oxidoreductase [Myxococcota bacterium]|jgi:NAD(P)-dependent dehydrogenase (short-subunit alcohol dehydrogenase family)|nr:SDR family oxidoreductase [Myxococcota bacterium]